MDVWVLMKEVAYDGDLGPQEIVAITTTCDLAKALATRDLLRDYNNAVALCQRQQAEWPRLVAMYNIAGGHWRIKARATAEEQYPSPSKPKLIWRPWAERAGGGSADITEPNKWTHWTIFPVELDALE